MSGHATKMQQIMNRNSTESYLLLSTLEHSYIGVTGKMCNLVHSPGASKKVPVIGLPQAKNAGRSKLHSSKA